MTGMKFENNQMQALAFMVMLAVISVMWDLGRASALKANAMMPDNAMSTAIQLPTGPRPIQMSGATSQYGLIQTGVVGIAPIDGNGATTMPVFQVVRLGVSNSNFAPTNGGGASAMPVAPETARAPQVETHVPSGINKAPPMDATRTATLCEVNTVQVITPSIEACLQAGGRSSQQH